MIIATIKRYVAIAGVLAFLALGAYAGYLKLKNGSQEVTIEKQEQKISTAVGANATLAKEVEQLKADSALNDELLLKREKENAGLEKEYAKTKEKLDAVKKDADWNTTVLVPCAVVRSLFADQRLGCREQAQ